MVDEDSGKTDIRYIEKKKKLERFFQKSTGRGTEMIETTSEKVVAKRAHGDGTVTTLRIDSGSQRRFIEIEFSDEMRAKNNLGENSTFKIFSGEK
ncbi:hypothetical protein [Devriesea agamarum]|uniref:hypothetical protein n=1 Tax=Devriesea agamarum TaxID=472569 RepID=UPI00071C4B38|nr:hypothetical protein [Devriesea agamarum]